MKFPAEELIDWFLEYRRALPWREQPTPYRVWISEVMLQQTQATVVIPYFLRWMEAFPTVRDLAEASIEKVIKLWEGLGYYSRARHLHEAAKVILEKYQGEIPSDPLLLAEIKGLGPYTVAAICAFAFHQPMVAIDGNVKRVLSRFFQIEEEIEKPSTLKKIQQESQTILPKNRPWLVSEGLIELGALVCKKSPECGECPLRKECLAYRNGLEKTLPRKGKKTATTYLNRLVAIIEYQGKYLVQRGEKGKVMADLYEFPYLEVPTPHLAEEEITSLFRQNYSPLVYRTCLPAQEHSFTRFQVKLFPHHFICKERREGEWKTKEELLELPFSSGHRRILKTLVSL